jgi:hypothetical protein
MVITGLYTNVMIYYMTREIDIDYKIDTKKYIIQSDKRTYNQRKNIKEKNNGRIHLRY